MIRWNLLSLSWGLLPTAKRSDMSCWTQEHAGINKIDRSAAGGPKGAATFVVDFDTCQHIRGMTDI